MYLTLVFRGANSSSKNFRNVDSDCHTADAAIRSAGVDSGCDSRQQRYPSLSGHHATNVAIVGGGMTGAFVTADGDQHQRLDVCHTGDLDDLVAQFPSAWLDRDAA